MYVQQQEQDVSVLWIVNFMKMQQVVDIIKMEKNVHLFQEVVKKEHVKQLILHIQVILFVILI